MRYCWWKESCTSRYGIWFRYSQGFYTSQVVQDFPSTIFHWIAANLLVFGYVFNLLFSRKLPLLKTHTHWHTLQLLQHTKNKLTGKGQDPAVGILPLPKVRFGWWLMWWWPVACKSSLTTMYLPYMFFPAYGGILGEQTARSAGVLFFRGTHPHVPLSYQLFAGHLTWKMAIQNLIIFITHLKKYHMLKTRCLWNSSGSNTKTPNPKHGREPRHLKFLNLPSSFSTSNTLASLSSSLARSRKKINPTLSSWWLNQPIWKILVKMVILPK